jgi:MoxR-like ATPase
MSDKQGIDNLVAHYNELKNEIHKVIIGQDDVVDQVLISIFSRSHCLLVGVPGLAKTLLVNTIAETLGLSFNRIQFTPDLMPSDIIGSEILDETKQFRFIKGPLFSNVLLADEINRTPPKTQSALLEAMQERKVTAAGKTYSLPNPFFVLATQNPIDQEGTYPLPEAQVDRFMLKVLLKYPSKEEEKLIIRSNVQPEGMPKAKKIWTNNDIQRARSLVRRIYVDEKIEQYIVDLVSATRNPGDYGLSECKKWIGFGASPRAGINMALAAKGVAFLNGRGFVIPEDIRSIAADVLRHRIGLTYEAEAENITQEEIISRIISRVEVP